MGLSLLVLSIVEFILKKDDNFILFRPLKTLGRGAFLGYLLHFLIIYKLSVVLNFNSILTFPASLALTIISTIAIYLAIKFWVNLKERKEWKVLWI